MANKELIVALEGTANLGRYWRSIYFDYLKKLVRSFCGAEEASPNVRLALVQFNVHGQFSPCLVQRSEWVRNVDYFMELLETMLFCGGGLCDAAIAEGLAEVLMMYPPPSDVQMQENNVIQNHCILVAASNPYPLPTPVYRPTDGTESQSRLSDAETVAKSFPQCFISLSIICPRQLPKLKSIYNAGKRNPSAADYTIDIVTNPHYLVLISEDFIASCTDLNQSGIIFLQSNRGPSNMEAASVSGMPTSCSPAVAKTVNSSGQSSITSMAGSASSSGTAQVAEHIIDDLLTSDVSSISWSSMLAMLELDLQENLQEPQFRQSGTSTNQNKMKGVAQSDMPATGTMMPAASAVQSSGPGYVELWEGDLTCELKGHIIFLTRLFIYRKLTAPVFLTEDWPSTMQIYKLIFQETVNKKKPAGTEDYLAFVAMHQHPILEKLKQHNVCTVILLPSHMLLLSVFDRDNTGTGTLFSKDTVA